MVDTDKPQDARAAVAAAADAAVRRGADAAQQGGRSTAEALRQNAEVSADVAGRGTDAGAEAFGRAGDIAGEMTRRGTQALVESQRRIAQDAAQRFEEVSRGVAEAARGTTENVRQLMALPNAAEGGLRDLQLGMTSLFEGVVQTNLRAVQELFRLADPAPFVELQQRFAREYTDTLLRNSAVLVRAVRRTADEALRPLEDQIQQQRGQTNDKGQPRYQTAAE